ncbi:hypothetical protein Bca4012_026736 [Brassica carinata]
MLIIDCCCLVCDPVMGDEGKLYALEEIGHVRETGHSNMYVWWRVSNREKRSTDLTGKRVIAICMSDGFKHHIFLRKMAEKLVLFFMQLVLQRFRDYVMIKDYELLPTLPPRTGASPPHGTGASLPPGATGQANSSEEVYSHTSLADLKNAPGRRNMPHLPPRTGASLPPRTGASLPPRTGASLLVVFFLLSWTLFVYSQTCINIIL